MSPGPRRLLLRRSAPAEGDPAVAEEGRGTFDAASAMEQIAADIGRHQQLSARQVEVLVLLTKGLTNKQIASTLGIDYRTAAEHLSRACRKFGVADRDELRAALVLAMLERVARARQAS